MPADTLEEFLQPLVGEPVLAGMLFMAPTSTSLSMMAVRMVQRAAKAGGIGAQFSAGGNLIAVTQTRVMLFRGIVQPLELIAQWPRQSVSGSAERKHRTGNGQRQPLWDQWLLRTTLTTPDGDVRVDLNEERGGRTMLAALGIAVPEQSTSRWRVTGPD
jgi:hypothetical protein